MENENESRAPPPQVDQQFITNFVKKDNMSKAMKKAGVTKAQIMKADTVTPVPKPAEAAPCHGCNKVKDMMIEGGLFLLALYGAYRLGNDLKTVVFTLFQKNQITIPIPEIPDTQ